MTTKPWPAPGTDAFTRRLVRELQQLTEHCAATICGQDAYRIAAAWVYTTALVAWAEDHGLTPGRLRADAGLARRQYAARGGLAAGWLAFAAADLAVHPSTWCLLDPRYGNPIKDDSPSEAACRALIRWWSEEAPPLAYDVLSGPASITGYVPGGLLQLGTAAAPTEAGQPKQLTLARGEAA